MLVSPEYTCSKCPRLCEFRQQNKIKYPHYHNGPVASFGELSANILVVGLAPGLNGANQTNRPFTNDYAGDILYPSLKLILLISAFLAFLLSYSLSILIKKS